MYMIMYQWNYRQCLSLELSTFTSKPMYYTSTATDNAATSTGYIDHMICNVTNMHKIKGWTLSVTSDVIDKVYICSHTFNKPFR